MTKPIVFYVPAVGCYIEAKPWFTGAPIFKTSLAFASYSIIVPYMLSSLVLGRPTDERERLHKFEDHLMVALEKIWKDDSVEKDDKVPFALDSAIKSTLLDVGVSRPLRVTCCDEPRPSCYEIFFHAMPPKPSTPTVNEQLDL
jgi:hypothetical protein